MALMDNAEDMLDRGLHEHVVHVDVVPALAWQVARTHTSPINTYCGLDWTQYWLSRYSALHETWQIQTSHLFHCITGTSK